MNDIGDCWRPGTEQQQSDLGVTLKQGWLTGRGRGCHQNEPEMTFTPTLANMLDTKQDETKRKHIQREPICPNEVLAPQPFQGLTHYIQFASNSHSWVFVPACLARNSFFNLAFPDGSFWPNSSDGQIWRGCFQFWKQLQPIRGLKILGRPHLISWSLKC